MPASASASGGGTRRRGAARVATASAARTAISVPRLPCTGRQWSSRAAPTPARAASCGGLLRQVYFTGLLHWQVLGGQRTGVGLRLPHDLQHVPAALLAAELDRVDAALERLRIGRRLLRRVGAEHLYQVAV